MISGRKRNSSVFLRYALSYTFVLLILFSGITVMLLNQTERQVRDNIVDTQINRLTRIAIQHEGYISSMLNTAEEIGSSPFIVSFSYDREPWKAYDLQRQLIPYTATSAFCDQVFLHFTGDEHLYSSSSSMTLSLFTDLMKYENVSPEELARLIRTADRLTFLPAQRVTSDLVDGSDPRMVTFILPLGNKPGTGKGNMLFLIKEQTYLSMFTDAIDGDINTYIRSGSGTLACMEDLPVDLSAAPAEIPDGGKYTSFRAGGEEYLLVSLGLSSWDMSYTAVLRMADVNSRIRGSLSHTLIILLILTAVCLLVALWIARRHAKPIQAISGLFADSADAPKEDELQRISTGIRQLTRHNSELISRLDRAVPMQRHEFVFRFTRGKLSSREEAVATARSLGLEIGRRYYAVILTGIPEETDQPFELNRPPFSDLPGISGAGVELVAIRGILYIAFSDRAEELPALAELLRSEGRGAGGRCVTAISAVHSDFSEAPTAYLEAAAAYDNRFVRGDQAVLAYDDISSNIADVLPQAKTLTNSISQALMLGNRDLLEDRITDLLRFLKNTSMSPFAFRMIYNNVIDTLTRAQAETLSSGRDARDIYDIFSLSSCQSVDDLDALLRRLCETLLTDARREDEAASPEEEGDIISQVSRYMDEHYSDPEISMAAIAESFDLSTTRLSLSFKEKTGMTPLEYLTLLRCEHAKSLLEQTDLSIRDIGIRVGYYDSGSFIRRFKQITGTTPLQYRREKTAPDSPEEKPE